MRWLLRVAVRSSDEKRVLREEGAASPGGSICRLRSCSEALGTGGRGRTPQLSQHCYISARLGRKRQEKNKSDESGIHGGKITHNRSFDPFLFLGTSEQQTSYFTRTDLTHNNTASELN